MLVVTLAGLSSAFTGLVDLPVVISVRSILELYPMKKRATVMSTPTAMEISDLLFPRLVIENT